GGVSLLIGIFLFSRYHSGLGRNYFFLTTSVFLLAIAEAFLRLAPDLQTAKILGPLTAACWYCTFLVYIYFAASFAERKFKYWPVVSLLTAGFLWLYATTNIVVSGYQRYNYGYGLVPGQGYYLNSILTIGLLSVGLYYLIITNKGAKEYYRRRQAGIFIMATILLAVVGEIIDHWLIFIGRNYVPLGLVSVAAIVVIAAVVILRYAPIFGVTKGEIAEAATNALNDPLFIVDNEKKIRYINPAVKNITGYDISDLAGHAIELLFSPEKEKTANLKKKNGKYTLVKLEMFKLSGDQGFIYLAKDLAPAVKMRKAVHKMTAQNNIVLRREKLIVEKINKFAAACSRQEGENIWKEIVENEGKLVEDALRPVYQIVSDYLELTSNNLNTRKQMTEKIAEIERSNRLMVDREQRLQELERKYAELKNR
ncbi:MAG: PAS domain S-box protein, partial [Candidatus Margulisbacteria bacterium]|nr:PAS domain S-box protein [Candidatus Margulisiibacteriota bacterium]